MRILLVASRTSGIGGIAQHVSELTRRLRDLGEDVDILSTENTPYVNVRRLKNLSFALISALKALRSRYDVVHVHGGLNSLVLLSARAERRVLTLHGIYSRSIGILHGGIIGRTSQRFEEIAFRRADVVTAVSRTAAEYYTKRLGREVLHIPNAIDLSIIPNEGRRFGDNQVVFVGRLSREKGIDVLLRAVRRLKTQGVRCTLVIVGDGPERNHLKEIAPENTRFLGSLPRREALEVVRGSDVFVLPSRYEGLSTSLLEAMACEIPVVATRVGGNSELVSDGENGFLANPDDPEDLGEKISLILEDRELARMFGAAGRRIVEENYSWDVVVWKYMRVYS